MRRPKRMKPMLKHTVKKCANHIDSGHGKLFDSASKHRTASFVCCGNTGFVRGKIKVFYALVLI